MQFCTCAISIGGDIRQVVVRDKFRPVSYPEIEILRQIHGHDAVNDVVPFVEVDQSAKNEKMRLGLIYGGVVEEVFPGKNPQMEMGAPKAKLEENPVWKSPIDVEVAGYDVPPEERRPEPKPAPKAKAEPFPG